MNTPSVIDRWFAEPFGLRGAEPEDQPQDDLVDGGAEEQEQEQAPEPSGKRAARQRAEAAEERATAAEQRLARLQSAEVARIASATLAVGADVFVADLGGSALADLLDEDGEVDPEAVREAAEAVATARPGLRVQRRGGLSGSPDGGARETVPRRSSWSDVIR